MGFYDFQASRLDGTPEMMQSYEGSVLLVVNTASYCGLTPQFEGLEALYQRFKDKGVVVLGFPCNQFAKQEPGTADEIGGFCQKNYGVSFPMFEKVDVNGKDAHPLYKWLTTEKRGFLGSKSIKWNFTKFLINQNGDVVKRYKPTTKPEDIEADIAALLAAS